MSSTGIESSGLNLFLRERRIRKRMQRANATAEAFVVSIPKSGRTWHRILLGYYLTRILQQDARNAVDLCSLCGAASIPLIAYTHNGTAMSDKLPAANELAASPLEWQNRKVLLLVREPRDVLVSAYFHARYRQQSFHGSIAEFVRNPYVGIEKLLLALNCWHSERHLAASFEVISYEQMRHRPGDVLRKTLRFAGIADVDDALVEESIDFTRVDNLQRLEQSDFFRSSSMRGASVDPRSRKVRSGKVGGFREHLSEDDLHFIAEAEARIGNPFSHGHAGETDAMNTCGVR